MIIFTHRIGGVIMPNFELTENLRSTIRDLRKSMKKRGDDLSKELGKGASYISQVENGKIKEIDFDLLDQIFRKITDLPETQYRAFRDNLLDNVTSHLNDKEIRHEKWLHQFNYELRNYPITESLIQFISTQINQLGYTEEEFVNIINQNRTLEDMNLSEPNKLQIEIVDVGNGEYMVISSIRFDLPRDFITNIINKKIRSINYITMEGILFNIFLSQGLSAPDAKNHSENLLYQNQFYTIAQRNALIKDSVKEKQDNNEDFTFYDVQPTDYDKEYIKLQDQIVNRLNLLRDKDIVYTCEKLTQVNKNMKFDLGLMIAIMSSPLCRISSSFKQEFWEEYKSLLNTFLDKSMEENQRLSHNSPTE